MAPATIPITTVIATGLCNNHLRLASAISDLVSSDVIIYYDTIDTVLPKMRAGSVVVPKYNDYSNYTVNYNWLTIRVDSDKIGLQNGVTQRVGRPVEPQVVTLPYFPSASIDFGVKQVRYNTLEKRISAYLNLMTLADMPEGKIIKRVDNTIILCDKPMTIEQQNAAMSEMMRLGFKNLKISAIHNGKVSAPIDIPSAKSK
jgi:hypothetical protein